MKRRTIAVLVASTLFASSATVVAAQAAKKEMPKTTASHVMTGHPDQHHPAAAIAHPAKPKPKTKMEAKPIAPRARVSWAPGAYYWGGSDWAWSNGYWQDQPWNDAIWISGHWTERNSGWVWIHGHWF